MNSLFRTIIELPDLGFQIEHSDRVFFAGSCFAENMAQRMRQSKFSLVCNPFGVLYNPLSIAGMLETLENRKVFSESDLIPSHDNSLWCSFSFHGSFSGEEPYEVLQHMNEVVVQGADAVEVADVVVLTFGTAWVYQLLDTEQIVANCHKFPESIFFRRLLSVEEIVDRYVDLIETTLKNSRIIFTVSPIRHLRDGLHENTISKAVLHLAIEELVRRYERVTYFPSYEIQIDDLRDYRFYAEDMLHPSNLAIDYIWSKFSDGLLSQSAKDMIIECDKIAKAHLHRPFNPTSPAHLKFRESIHSRILKLQEEAPYIDFSSELTFFK